MMRITDFGTTSKGESIQLYTLTNNNGMEIAVTDLGATLVSVIVNGTDVVLGYDDAAGYEADDLFLGTIVGRHANRIGGASFELNGVEYKLVANSGPNSLHSGPDFYNMRKWGMKEAEGQKVTFTLESPHMDQGFPGNLHIEVSYELTEENEVRITYHAVPDEDTIVNLTNHSYFNLNGHDTGLVLEQEVWIDADEFTRTDANSVPTGEILSVEGTPMDFRQKKAVGRDIEEDYEALILGKGYDHNWILKNNGRLAKVAEMTGNQTGITMEVYTDLPGVQLYTGNYIVDPKGKGGAVYGERHGLCFETQMYPDAIHHTHFPSPIVRKGESFDSVTIYKFK